jgi:hypothetical protein
LETGAVTADELITEIEERHAERLEIDADDGIVDGGHRIS